MALPLIERVGIAQPLPQDKDSALQDCIGKPLLVAETSATHLDHLDSAAGTSCRTITYFQNNSVQYFSQMILDWLQAVIPPGSS